ASQYDPTLDADLYNYQQQQQQQQHRSSLDRARSQGGRNDFGTATRHSNVTPSEHSTSASATSAPAATTSGSAFSSTLTLNTAPGSFLGNTTSEKNVSLTDNESPVNEENGGEHSRRSYLPWSILKNRNSKTISQNGLDRAATSSIPTTEQLIEEKDAGTGVGSGSNNRDGRDSAERQASSTTPRRRHSRAASLASVASRLVSKASRASLDQFNYLRSGHFRSPSGLGSGATTGTQELNVVPSALYGGMGTDPALVREQQLLQQQGLGLGASGTDYRPTIGYNTIGYHGMDMNASTGTIVGAYQQSRQEDGRIQLEQEREYMSTRRLKTWTKSKIVLLLSNIILFCYSTLCTDVMIKSWTGAEWTKLYLDSGIMMVANRKLLFIMMTIGPFGIALSILGFFGIFTQNRKALTIYTVLLWPLFGLITSVGYISYRRVHVSLYQKLKNSWISEYTRDDRLVIQNALSCCGFRSLGDYPSYDLHCFPRAPLPACESRFLLYQQQLLARISGTAFSILAFQLMVMLVALLCSNHIDRLYRTAYPITPKLYTQ
ncbi:hypothetical protein BGW38_002976, partial [Lunasporangiospora selenospora]